MASGFGQGGKANALPSRGRPEYGTATRDEDQFQGGQRGPAALPSRTTVAVPPAPVRMQGGNHGTISNHRGAYIEDAGAPRVEFDNVLGHMAIPWNRPVYANIQGLLRYVPPTQLPSWSANSEAVVGHPTVPVPNSNKRIANFTVREEFGSTRELYNNGSLATFVASIRQGLRQQGRRWMAQAKTANPWLKNLSAWGPAGSYGQTTRVLATAPTNRPAGTPQSSGMVSY